MEVDETKVGRRKNHKGRVVDGCWIFGLIEGYQHLTVNHSQNFVDPVSGAHTQRIESSWRALKRRLSRGGIKKDEYGLHFAEYLWFQRYSEDSFLSLVSHIAEIY